MTVRVVIRVANLADRSRPRLAKFCARQAFTKPGGYGLPDIVLFSEASTVDLATVASNHARGWLVVQHGAYDSPAAGVAIASRYHLRPLRPVIGSAATREGGGIRQRPRTGARLGWLPIWADHAPPPRSPIARAAYLSRVALTRGICGGDYNREPGWMRRTFQRKYRAVGVLGVLVPRRFKVSEARPVHIGSDHPACDVVVWLPARLLKEKKP